MSPTPFLNRASFSVLSRPARIKWLSCVCRMSVPPEVSSSWDRIFSKFLTRIASSALRSSYARSQSRSTRLLGNDSILLGVDIIESWAWIETLSTTASELTCPPHGVRLSTWTGSPGMLSLVFFSPRLKSLDSEIFDMIQSTTSS